MVFNRLLFRVGLDLCLGGHLLFGISTIVYAFSIPEIHPQEPEEEYYLTLCPSKIP
jgi:hypothetical protein